MLGKEEYAEYCLKFKRVWSFLSKHSIPRDKVVQDICSLRGYDYVRMGEVLRKADFIFIQEGKCDYSKLSSNKFKELALFSKEGKFLLSGRYIFPVKDMLGNIVSLIGWFPDEKRYITTPSKLFSKDCLFYGMEQLSETGIGKTYVLVEGIFDSLSVRSLGFPCISMMGVTSSKYKQVLYTLFRRLLGIPDADSEGRKVIVEDRWKLPQNSKYLKWTGVKAKDIDDFILKFTPEDTQEIILDAWREDSRIVSVDCRI